MDGLYFVEWSASQGSYHIQDATKSLKDNLAAMLSGRYVDYVPLAVCETYDDAVALLDAVAEWGGRHPLPGPYSKGVV